MSAPVQEEEDNEFYGFNPHSIEEPHLGEPSTILGGGPYRLFEKMKGANDVHSETDTGRIELSFTSEAKELLYGLGNLRGRLEPRHLEAILTSDLRASVLDYFAEQEVIVGSNCENLSSDELGLLREACFEALSQHAPVVREYEVEEDFGPYTVALMGVPGAYFISALERDPIGPFTSIETAHKAVLVDFEGLFI